MDAPETSYAEALSFLRARRLVDFESAEGSLGEMVHISQVFQAYRQLFPDGSRMPKLPRRLADVKSLPSDALIDMMGDALGELFPIDNMVLLEDGLEYIPMAQISPSMSWDEFDELLNAPEEFLDYEEDDPLRFMIMVWTIGNAADKETWETLSDELGWGVKYPKKLMQSDEAFDMDALEKNLKAAGLGPFMSAINIAWKNTGCPFLDFDRESEWYPSFSTNNIVKLAKEWRLGEKYVLENQLATAMWQADKSVLQKVVDIMSRSLGSKQKPGKTLVEVFAQEGDLDELFESEDN